MVWNCDWRVLVKLVTVVKLIRLLKFLRLIRLLRFIKLLELVGQLPAGLFFQSGMVELTADD